VYASVAVAFVALATWGSWFPFVFRPLPWDVAVEWLWWSATPAQFSLTDALSNLLLFVPIGVFAASVLGRRRRLRDSVAVIALGAALSLALELGQLLVPWRIPSVLDIAFETAGMVVGVFVRRVAAAELDDLTDRLITAWRTAGMLDRVLWAYAASFAIAWLMPFDFTIRPDEIGDKFEHKRLVLPWMPSPDAATTAESWLTAAAAVPLGWALVLCTSDAGWRRSVATAIADAAALLVALTLLQVTVFSRTTDITLTFAAIGGAAAGAILAARMTVRTARPPDHSSMRFAALAATWIAAVIAIEWWPLQFNLDVDRIRQHAAAWSYAPFRAPAAAADVVPGTLLAIAGAVIASPGSRAAFARLHLMAALIAAGALFATIEAGHLLVETHTPTLASVAIKLLAFAVTLAFASAAQPIWSPQARS
jgi:glycopeptide antibiotics resistance protein